MTDEQQGFFTVARFELGGAALKGNWVLSLDRYPGHRYAEWNMAEAKDGDAVMFDVDPTTAAALLSRLPKYRRVRVPRRKGTSAN